MPRSAPIKFPARGIAGLYPYQVRLRCIGVKIEQKKKARCENTSIFGQNKISMRKSFKSLTPRHPVSMEFNTRDLSLSHPPSPTAPLSTYPRLPILVRVLEPYSIKPAHPHCTLYLSGALLRSRYRARQVLVFKPRMYMCW
jgi:hypothetical protein